MKLRIFVLFSEFKRLSNGSVRFNPLVIAMFVVCMFIGVCNSSLTGSVGTEPGSNPLFRDTFTADPAPLVVGDTLYLYAGHDDAHEDQMFNINEWLCYSTTDMKHWTAHGPVFKPTDFDWATGDAWASQVVEKDGKFYFYTTVQHGEPHVGKAIGVAVGDSPLGPFTDARGTALVTDETTPSDKPWNDIDPTVFIDDDGTAYLAWGNPYLYFAKLKPNMIEIDGEIEQIELPNYTEGPWLHKRGDTYYLTYAAFAHQGMWEKICYATAPTIHGPWTYQGILTDQTENSYTIHPGIVEFKGQWYFFYHNAELTLNGEKGGLGRRAVCAEYLVYNPDGTIQPITQTVEGVSIPREQITPLYLDPTRPREARIKDLLSRMTLDEKASMMNNSTPGVPRLGIPKYNWWNEALHGVARADFATVFPQAIGLAAMWDEPLQGEISHVIGMEARAKFDSYKGTPHEGEIYRGLTFWSPNVNIFRDPRWGRGQETYGEDPFLTSRLGVAFVKGLQGNNPDYLVAAACGKHFAVHSGPEPLRHDFDVSPSKADLHETYLPAFKALVEEADVEIIMTAYNSLYGTPCSVSPLLYGLLDEWKFGGHVTSDCGSLTDLIRTYSWASNDAEAEALALIAGMNVCCGNEGAAAAEAVRLGLVTEQVMNEGATGLLRTMFRLGFFDPEEDVPFNNIPLTENDSPEHRELALRAAHEALVLLKNDGTLPLDPGKYKKIAVIGPNAASVDVLQGNYHGRPSSPVSILNGIKSVFEPEGIEVEYAHGCDYAARPNVIRQLEAGWFSGQYYDNPNFEGEPIVTRWNTPLRFDFAAARYPEEGLPEGLPEENISIRWTGDLQTTLAGDYQFVVRGRGGFRISFDGETVIDSLTPPVGEEATEREVRVTHHLPENATLKLELDYVQGDGPVKLTVEWNTPPADAGVAEALEIADKADAIIFVGGISARLEGEEMAVAYEGFKGGDRLSIDLPAVQQQLLQQLQATGKPMVFVNLSGSAVAFPWADDHLNAVLQAWYPGQAGGTAIADVLLGNYNPAGRLPVTFYRSTEDLPDFENYDMEGRTYRYFKGEPLYPFGHGLSYTEFEYRQLKATPQPGGGLEVTLDVTNSGDRDGDEVVQVYATPPAASNPREIRALCGFERIHLKAGETKSLRIMVPAAALLRWNDDQQKQLIPPGKWTIATGASSADIRQTTSVEIGSAR